MNQTTEGPSMDQTIPLNLRHPLNYSLIDQWMPGFTDLEELEKVSYIRNRRRLKVLSSNKKE
jgi:hypothetical protein